MELFRSMKLFSRDKEVVRKCTHHGDRSVVMVPHRVHSVLTSLFVTVASHVHGVWEYKI